MMRSPRAIAGTLARSRPRASRTYRSGRVCDREACATILSRYNPSRFCSIHEPVRLSSTFGHRGKRAEPPREVHSRAG